MNNTDVFKSYYHKRSAVSWSYKDILLIVLFLIIFQMAFAFILGFFSAILRVSKIVNLLSYINFLFYVSFFCFFVWLIFYRYKIKIESIGLIKKKIKFQHVLLGVLIAFVLQFVYIGLTYLYPNLSDADYLQYLDLNLTNTFSIILSGIPIIFLVPIVEEIFFRGLLFQKLRDNFSLAVALVIQSFFFTITHYQYYYSYYILFIFLIGLAAGLIYYITNNLRSAIYFHITYNLIWFVGFLYSIK